MMDNCYWRGPDLTSFGDTAVSNLQAHMYFAEKYGVHESSFPAYILHDVIKMVEDLIAEKNQLLSDLAPMQSSFFENLK